MADIKPMSLEQIYEAGARPGGSKIEKPIQIKNLGLDEFENSGLGGQFIGNYTDKALNYSDKFEKSMNRPINKTFTDDYGYNK